MAWTAKCSDCALVYASGEIDEAGRCPRCRAKAAHAAPAIPPEDPGAAARIAELERQVGLLASDHRRLTGEADRLSREALALERTREAQRDEIEGLRRDLALARAGEEIAMADVAAMQEARRCLAVGGPDPALVQRVTDFVAGRGDNSGRVLGVEDILRVLSVAPEAESLRDAGIRAGVADNSVRRLLAHFAPELRDELVRKGRAAQVAKMAAASQAAAAEAAAHRIERPQPVAPGKITRAATPCLWIWSQIGHAVVCVSAEPRTEPEAALAISAAVGDAGLESLLALSAEGIERIRARTAA